MGNRFQRTKSGSSSLDLRPEDVQFLPGRGSRLFLLHRSEGDVFFFFFASAGALLFTGF